MYTKLKLTTQYTIWAFVLITIVAAPISGILWIGKQFVLLPINNQSDLIQKHGIFLAFLMICLIGPCIEEVLFRYPITLERKVLLRSFALGMLFKLTLVLFGKTESFVANIILSNLCWISIILYYARKEYGLKAKSAAGYISMVFFALLHLTNFNNLHWNNFIFAFIQVIPLGILAFFLNKTRIQCGILYCIGIHILYNLITFIFTLPTMKWQ